jgi:protein SCO1/2
MFAASDDSGGDFVRKTRIILWLLVATAIAVFGARWVTGLMQPEPPAPTAEEKARSARDVAREAITGEFSLVDHDGNPVTDEDYRGSWLLIFFGYTHCPDVCPTTLGAVSVAMDILGEDAAQVQPLFISVDPQRDTPEVLKDYASAFHPSIIGLTGTPEQIKAAAQTHRAYYAKAPSEEGGEIGETDYAMDHSAYLYLMDPEGVYAHAFSPTDTPEEIAKRIRRYLNE